MTLPGHCACCPRSQGFGIRRLRVYLLLTRHPEFDQPDFRGVLIAETDRNCLVRGEVREDKPLPVIEAA